MMAPDISGHELVLSVSGGKDSTAMCLHMFELGYGKSDFSRVFMDTGWEHPGTYEYLDQLEEIVGKITRLRADFPLSMFDEEVRGHILHFEGRLGFESPMIRRIFRYTGFPSSRIRWCTDYLKMKPLRDHFGTIEDDHVNVVGVRGEESVARSRMEEWEWSDGLDCWVWRPLIAWTEQEVIDIHARFGVFPNRLYMSGSQRVGCWPCINSRKLEVSQIDEERISIIRDLEKVVTVLRRKRKGPEARRANFFQMDNADSSTIDDVRLWSRTARGGKQMPLLSMAPRGCMKWGLCERM